MAKNPRKVGDFTLTIATEVRRQRLRRRWEQKEMSAKSGIPQGTLSRIERGLAAIDTEQLDDIAKSYGMLPEELITSARANAGQPVELGDAYLPDGTLNPSEVDTTRTSDEHLNALRARKNLPPLGS